MTKYHAAIVRASADADGGWTRLAEALLPGAHVVVLGDMPDWETSSLHARRAGLILRDTLAVVLPAGVMFCPLFRKEPELESIADQLRTTRTGAIHVDACRVGTRWPTNLAFMHADACQEASCADECQVPKLDKQSGTLRAGWFSGAEKRGLGFMGAASKADRSKPARSTGDSGGASRYFKQFRTDDDLVAYLQALVLPPGGELLTEFPRA